MKKNLKNLMQLLALMIALMLIAPVTVHAQAKANFAGTWALNTEKSALPQGGPGGGGAGGGGGGGGRGMFGGGNFTVTQDANTLSQMREGPDGTITTKYTLDGKETTNSMGFGDSKSTATWSADGKKLTVVTKMDFNGNEMITTAVWSLIDASTLSIETTRPGRDGGSTTTKMVYDKK
jgi:hypothetical protein